MRRVQRKAGDFPGYFQQTARRNMNAANMFPVLTQLFSLSDRSRAILPSTPGY
jgi:hypothetical protein